MTLHPSAERVAANLEASTDPVKAFVTAGGRLTFSCGTNVARLFGIAASATHSEEGAVAAWGRAVQRKALANKPASKK